MADIIPFNQLATLDNPVFKAAGVTPAAEPAPAAIPFDQIESAPAAAIDPSQITHVDDFHRRTVDDLHNDDKFDPRQYFSDNPDVAKDPAQLQKLIDVYRARRERGVTLGAVGEGIKAAPGTAVKFAKGLGTLANNVFEFSGLQPIFNKAASVVTGDAFNTQRAEALEKESENRARQAYSEFQAGTELSATGLSDLARTGARKIFGKPVKDLTNQELLAQLSEDAAFQNQLREVQSGRGETLKNSGLDADTLAKEGIHLDSNAIENLSLVDPATVIATAGLFKVVGTGGKILATAASEAGAAKAATALNNLATQTAGKIVQGTGNAITAAGEGAAKVVGAVPEAATEAAGAGIGLAKTGSVSGAYVGAKAARGVQAGIVKGGQAAAKVGEAINELGQQITGQLPVSAGVQKLSNFVSTYGRPVTGALKGAAIGTLAAAPIALLADENQTAGGILSGGIALGGVAGAAHGTFGAVTDAAANRYFGPHEKLLPAVDSPAYGIEPALDAANQAATERLPIRERNLINNFREGTRNVGGEFYTLNEAEYKQQVADAYKRETGQDITPDLLQKYADTHAQFSEYRPDANGNVRKVVLLNADATGLLHDAGHLFDASLTPEVADSLRQAIRETFTPEQLADAQARYERRLGTKLTPERAMDEFVAEQFNALFHNVPLTEMTAPRSLLGKFIDTIAKGAEALGVDLTGGKVTPSLGNPLSVGLRELFKNAAAEVVKANEKGIPTTPAAPTGPAAPTTPPPVTPAGGPTANPVPIPHPGSAAGNLGGKGPIIDIPGAPGAPAAPATPAVRNIRVTQAQQDAFAKRAAETGVTEAKANAKEPETAARVKEISDSMEAGNPVLEIEHLGITNAGSPAVPTGRTVRRGEQAKGYAELEAIRANNRANAPASIVNTHQKTFVPVRWTNQGGTPTLIAMSLDKVIRNMHSIVADAAGKGVADRIPYENANGKLTEAGWNKAVADAQAYAENQSNGFRGDGRQLVRPTEDLGFSIPAENPDYKPQILGEAEANFQNLIQGLATPETAREQKGLTPGNIKGQVLAEANKRPTLTPAQIKPRNVGKQEFKLFPGRSLKEVNPLRNELAKAGVDVRDLIEVTERIRAKDVASVKPRPDLNFKAPVTDIIRGGFLPPEERPGEGGATKFIQQNTVDQIGKEILEASPEKWQKLTSEIGGLTGAAYKLGVRLTYLADVKKLRNFESEAKTQYNQAKVGRDFDGMMLAATKKQFFTEAIETATGMNPNKQETIARVLGPNWKPPFPEAAADEIKFLPKVKNPDAVDSAAVRDTESGQIFIASTHGEAMRKAAIAGGTPEKEFSLSVSYANPNLEQGFVTQSGDFLTRAEARDRVLETGQITPENIADASQLKNGRNLESVGFEHYRKFLPGEETDRARRAGLLPDKAPPHTPSIPIRTIAAAYAKSAGIDYSPDPTYVPVSPVLGRKLADFYDQAKSNPEDPKVKASYGALIGETESQAKQILDGGYTIEPYTGEGEPYKSSAEMVADVRNNKHLYFLQTNKTFGGKGGVAAAANNPMLAESTVVPGQRVNDVFRWVHDFFGHAKEGYQFGPRGEFNAWRTHSQMYSPEAQGALAGETLAQNSWVNYGKHLEGKDVPQAERPFAEQKVIVVPQNLIDEAHAVANGEIKFLPRSKEEVQFLPKKKAEEKPIEFPGYVVPAPQNVGLEKTVDQNGVTEQFWINSKTGKIILAPDGHEEAANLTVLRNEPKIRESDDLAAVFDAMHARGWMRGVLEPDDTAQPGIHLNGPPDLVLGASARRTMEDIAFKLDRPVLLNDRQLDIGPVQPNELGAPEPLFMPKKVKRDDEGRPLTAEGLIDYERLYKETAAAKKKQQEEQPIKNYDIPNNQQGLSPKGLTGWLLPDKKFVPLDTQYHEQFLAENADKLNEQFGTDFSKVSDVDSRLAALNAGFTRLRFEANRGALHIETAAKNWADSRKQILDQVLKAQDSIDNLFVSLLDAQGKVVDSIHEKLFEAEGKEKLNKIEEAIDSLRARGSRFLPGELAQEEAKTFVAAQDLEKQWQDLMVARRATPFHSEERQKLNRQAGKLTNQIEAAWRENTSAMSKRLAAKVPVSDVQDAIEKLRSQKFLPAGELPEARVNIGLAVNGKDNAISHSDVLAELERAGVKVLKSSVVKSNTENTVVADLDKPLTPEQATAIATALKQDAIGQYAGGKGELYGPKAEDWRPFNPEFFLNHEGQPLGEAKSKFLAKEQALPGFKAAAEDDKTKLAENAIARAKNDFPEARLPVYARDDKGNVRLNWEGAPMTVPVDYDLSNTPLAKEAAKGLKGPDREKAIAAALGDKLVREYKSAVKNPAIEAGSKWYSTARTRLRKLLGDDAKFFAELLGATSPQTGVEMNFKYAVEAYNQFKSGAYDEMLAKYREGKKAWADADIDEFLRDTKIEQPTRGQFLDWWVKKNNLTPEQSNGKRFGLHSRAVLRVLDRSWLSEVQGPKTPNFTGNLTGETFNATIDVWSARMLHRLANEGNPKRWRILPGNETGVADSDFYLGQAAYRHAAEKLGIKPDSLQAILWFFEKNYWESRGWTKNAGAKKSDFNSLLKETERTPGGLLQKKTAQQELELVPKETTKK